MIIVWTCKMKIMACLILHKSALTILWRVIGLFDHFNVLTLNAACTEGFVTSLQPTDAESLQRTRTEVSKSRGISISAPKSQKHHSGWWSSLRRDAFSVRAWKRSVTHRCRTGLVAECSISQTHRKQSSGWRRRLIHTALYYELLITHSGTARVNEVSRSFTCHPHVYPLVKWPTDVKSACTFPYSRLVFTSLTFL